jgi:hypothetical protein
MVLSEIMIENNIKKTKKYFSEIYTLSKYSNKILLTFLNSIKIMMNYFDLFDEIIKLIIMIKDIHINDDEYYEFINLILPDTTYPVLYYPEKYLRFNIFFNIFIYLNHQNLDFFKNIFS